MRVSGGDELVLACVDADREAAVRRVGVGMVEDVQRAVVVVEDELERLADPRVRDDDADEVTARVPEQRHLDAVGRAVLELSSVGGAAGGHGCSVREEGVLSMPAASHSGGLPVMRRAGVSTGGSTGVFEFGKSNPERRANPGARRDAVDRFADVLRDMYRTTSPAYTRRHGGVCSLRR